MLAIIVKDTVIFVKRNPRPPQTAVGAGVSLFSIINFLPVYFSAIPAIARGICAMTSRAQTLYSFPSASAANAPALPRR